MDIKATDTVYMTSYLNSQADKTMPPETQAPTGKTLGAVDTVIPVAPVLRDPADVAKTKEKADRDTSYVARSSDYLRASAAFQSSNSALKFAFADFKGVLQKSHPDLAGKDFGFTLDQNGKLKVLDSSGSLSDEEITRLSALLNAAQSLKQASSQFREASITLVKLDSREAHNLGRSYILNKGNFASTIDLAAIARPWGDEESQLGTLASQLQSKGQSVPLIHEIV